MTPSQYPIICQMAFGGHFLLMIQSIFSFSYLFVQKVTLFQMVDSGQAILNLQNETFPRIRPPFWCIFSVPTLRLRCYKRCLLRSQTHVPNGNGSGWKPMMVGSWLFSRYEVHQHQCIAIAVFVHNVHVSPNDQKCTGMCKLQIYKRVMQTGSIRWRLQWS
jgi:hypothetical protein